MLDFNNTHIVPRTATQSGVDSRKNVNLEVEYVGMHSGAKIIGVPIILANLDSVGTVAAAKAAATMGVFTCLHKYHTKEELQTILQEEHLLRKCFVSIGLQEYNRGLDYDFLSQFPLLCLDVANGYIKGFIKMVKDVRQKLPHVFIMAGNIATVDGAVALATAGADMIKVGIGPGELCQTREVTGVGYPQLAAIKNIRLKLPSEVLICSDGGCRVPGDTAKCFVAGANFVMMGSYFAGCQESNSVDRIDRITGEIKIYGMASETALDAYSEDLDYRPYEGKEKYVQNKGPIKKLLKQLLGGLRSCCTYCDSLNLQQLAVNGQLLDTRNGETY